MDFHLTSHIAIAANGEKLGILISLILNRESTGLSGGDGAKVSRSSLGSSR